MLRISFTIILFMNILSFYSSTSSKHDGRGICYKLKILSKGESTQPRLKTISKENASYLKTFGSIGNKTHFYTPYCCPGYEEIERHGTILNCAPICQPNCVNSKCTAPNICTCLNGFILMEDNKTCSIDYTFEQKISNQQTFSSDNVNIVDKKNTDIKLKRSLWTFSECACENGDCIENNKCKCHNGFKLSNDDPLLCTPVCKNGCLNGDCIGPNFCKCHEGYIMNLTNLYECYPHCNPECINGKCVQQDVCQCYANYTKVENRRENECYPKCDKCTNGLCITPNECICFHSYTLKDGDCEPICNPKCINSTCTEPDKCECFEGYKTNPSSEKHICEPSCDPKCINSDCIAPNTCECHNNYKKKSLNDSFCEPICKNGCKHGHCVSPDLCVCDSGYMKDEQTSVCSPTCHPPCKNSECIEPDTCECHDGFFKPPLNNNSHICESKITTCKRTIQNGLKKIYNSSCYEFDNITKTYEKQCRIDFTNTSCYDEYCKNNRSEICEASYSCEIWPDIFNSSSIIAQCKWEGKIEDKDNNGEQNTSYTTLDKKLFPNISGIFHEHSFKNNFDDSPCLLCFCQDKGKRRACTGDKINFKICQCPDDDLQKGTPSATSSGGGNRTLVILTTIIIIALVICCGLLVFFSIKIALHRRDSNVYRVQTYSNTLYEGYIEQTTTESLLAET